MRECPKCGELNGENNTHCYKCKTFLGVVANYEKKCPYCGEIYNGSKNECDYCGETLVTYDDSYDDHSNSSSAAWMYVCAILIPILGIILGCIRMVVDRDSDSGKPLIILSIVLTIAYPLLYMMIFSA